MKTIGSFKLHKGGEAGIEITTEQLSRPINGEIDQIFHDEVNTFRKDSVPAHILIAIEKLKYFFLNITGYWIEVYDQYLDYETNTLYPMANNAKPGRVHLQNLWDNVSVTQVKIDNNSWTLLGQIEVIDGKPLALNPQKVTPQDDVEFYENTRETIKGIMALLVNYFSTAAIRDVNDMRKYLLSHADESRKADIANLDETQIVNQVIDAFAHRGMIVMADGDISDSHGLLLPADQEEESVAPPPIQEELEQEPNEDIPEPTTAVEEDQDMEAGDDWTPPTEKAPDPFGAPAAGTGPAEPVPESAAFSENIGDEVRQVEGASETLSDDDFV